MAPLPSEHHNTNTTSATLYDDNLPFPYPQNKYSVVITNNKTFFIPKTNHNLSKIPANDTKSLASDELPPRAPKYVNSYTNNKTTPHKSSPERRKKSTNRKILFLPRTLHHQWVHKSTCSLPIL